LIHARLLAIAIAGRLAKPKLWFKTTPLASFETESSRSSSGRRAASAQWVMGKDSAKREWQVT